VNLGLAARPAPGFDGGFTLIELLVVIGCIALLAGLLLPSLQAAQSKGKRIHCISNLHQMGIGLQIYVDDNKSYPVAMNLNGLGNWQRTLLPSVSDPVLYCPQLTQASEQFLEYFPTNSFIFPHYGYNAYGAMRVNPPAQNPGLGGNYVSTGHGAGNYVGAADNWVRVPSQMIAMGDSMTFFPPPLIATAVTPADPLYNIFPYVSDYQNYPGVGKYHAGGANLIFCDAHVLYARQADWLDAGGENKRRWNWDNQSHPEFQ